MPSFSTSDDRFGGTRQQSKVVSMSWPPLATGEPVKTLWPAETLEAFCLRMMAHGLCVSNNLMQQDRRYALTQLAYANSMNDDVLRELAQDLFQHFQVRQSGVAHLN
jgi:hypothetical protein